ncbi:MAG TPA: DUF4382 domain-containing protein [Candidatus Eisenbacteria bacterium]|nr:DUF4382 domain-containing protein [Candidatus Eisenbacteria bacterium]
MNTKRFLAVLAALVAMAGLAGCSDNDDDGVGPTTGRLQVQLTDAATVLEEVNIVVTEIAVHRSGSDTTSWEVIRDDSTTVDVLTLQNGVIRQLAVANVPSGRYTQIRLKVGAGSTVVDDGVTHPLVIPSGFTSGIKILGNFDVPAGGTSDLTLDFDARRSVHMTGAGVYMLRPVIRMVVNRATTAGTIIGRLQPDSTAAYVYAIRSGTDTVQTARAALSGQFILSTLPVGTYTVAIDPDTAYRDTVRTSVNVTAGATTNVGDIVLTHEPVAAPVVATRRRH